MLELKNISFKVENKDILKDINLTIDSNKIIAITGPNGSGKSTLAKIIMGIEKPTEGEIIFNGKNITEYTTDERAKIGISFAFQQPVKFKGITVYDLIKLSANKEIKFVEACKILSSVGLCAKDYINREVDSSLSGGELKRIEIATVVARGTKLTIFDEPEAGIDLWSFNNLIEVFNELNNTTKGTSIIISHQERILKIADEIIILEEGILLEQGTSEDLLNKVLGLEKSCKYQV